MKTLYFDCFSGISGDMTIAALVDVGVDFAYLKDELSKLPLIGFEVNVERVERANLSAVKFDVAIDNSSVANTDRQGHHTHNNGLEPMKASGIIDLIQESKLTKGARKRAVEIFEKLAIAEGKVHDVTPAEVEFHEIGAVDSIVDVVGTAIGLDALGVESCVCSPVNVGAGFVKCQHGHYPVPAPATANLLKNIPVYSKHVEEELVTPTGAAILAATIDRFGPLEKFKIDRVGYGAGTKQFENVPNCLRLFVGETTDSGGNEEGIVVLEANIDDMSPENLAFAVERLISAGALDVITIPAQMKKGRSGHLIQVLSPLGSENDLSKIMFDETTTIGVRLSPMSRKTLDREVVLVETSYGSAGVKVSRYNGRIINASPEYEDCAKLARGSGQPFKVVQAEVLKAYFEMNNR